MNPQSTSSFGLNSSYLDKKVINKTLEYHFQDDQLRLLFTVILLIGIILLVSNTSGAYIFLIVGFGLLAFMCIYTPKKHSDEEHIPQLKVD